MDIVSNQYEDAGITLPGQYCLQVGSPGPALLKKIAEYMEEGTRCLSQRKRHEETLQYSSFQGGNTVRRELAGFLSRQYGQTVSSDDLFVTNGASSGLDVLMKHFFTSAQTLFVENPTYKTFASHAVSDKLMTIRHIELESDGINVDALQEELVKLPDVTLTKRRPFRAALYLIPVHHNPTGVCYSAEKCRRLVELARRYELLVICDDVYNVLNYLSDRDDPDKFLFSPARLFAYDSKSDPDYRGNVVSNGTFSKIAAPGLRLGWYEAPKRVSDSLIDSFLIESSSGQNSYLSFVMAEVLHSGRLDEHVQVLRKKYKESMKTAIGIIETQLGKYGIKCSHPSGGVFLWVELPHGVTAVSVLNEAKSVENVTFLKGELTSIVGDFSNFIRISIAFYELPQLKTGIEKLCRAIEVVIVRQN